MRSQKTARKATPVPQPPLASSSGNGVTEGVLTLKEAAAYLRVSEEQILRMVREQNLRARRVGSDWRFLKSAIDDWLRTGPAPLSNKEAWDALLEDAWKKKDMGWDELLEQIHLNRKRLAEEIAEREGR